MITYQCSACGESLESPDSLAGIEESCPSCKAANYVPPPSKIIPTALEQITADNKYAKRTLRMALLGCIGGIPLGLMAGGITLLALASMHRDTSTVPVNNGLIALSLLVTSLPSFILGLVVMKRHRHLTRRSSGPSPALYWSKIGYIISFVVLSIWASLFMLILVGLAWK